jgi:hypothetical protein
VTINKTLLKIQKKNVQNQYVLKEMMINLTEIIKIKNYNKCLKIKMKNLVKMRIKMKINTKKKNLLKKHKIII